MYFVYESRTRRLVELLNHGNLEELQKVTVIDDSSLENSTIIDDRTQAFPTLIDLLNDLEMKKAVRSQPEFSHMEGYTILILLDDTSHHISINENGTIRFEEDFYKIQSEESFKQLLRILGSI